MLARRLCLISALALLAGSHADTGEAQQPGVRPDYRMRYAPRVRGYDLATDTFTYHSSVLNPPTKPARGAYYGDRMTQYRFIGLPREKGIYGAFEDYYRRLNHDPAGYRYRFR